MIYLKGSFIVEDRAYRGLTAVVTYAAKALVQVLQHSAHRDRKASHKRRVVTSGSVVLELRHGCRISIPANGKGGHGSYSEELPYGVGGCAAGDRAAIAI